MRVSNEEYQEAFLIWKGNNPEKENVSQVVILPSGKKVPLGNRINTMKSIYQAMQEGKHYGKNRDLTEEEIIWWMEHGLDLGEKRRMTYTEEEYREAYLLWKETNPKGKRILSNLVVTLPSGKKVLLGKRIAVMKYIYKAMQEGKHYGKYRNLTKEKIIWWEEQGVDLGERRTFRCTEEEYREAYLLWKKENPKEKNIPSNLVVTLPSGKNVPLGNRINTMKSIYHAMQKGEHYGKNSDLTEDEISWWTEHGISFEKTGLLRRKTQNAWIVKNILSEFDVDFKEFIESIEPFRTKKKTETFDENIEEQTLKQLCVQGGYNYKIVSSTIKIHALLPNETLEQLINRMLLRKQNKKEISSWISEVYGSMVEKILLELNLNPKQVFKYMSENLISLEEAIYHSIFSSTCKNQECDYLEDIYEKIIIKIDFQTSEEENAEKIVNQIVKIGKRNHLMDGDISVLIECFKNYIQTMREYQIIDVGLEVNEEEKFRKIQIYNLTEEEIEESYFVPFRFEEEILLGEKSELYKRRELLRQYIIDWNYYTEEEKESVKEEHHFTEEEFSMMEEIRRKIDKMTEGIQKVKNSRR